MSSIGTRQRTLLVLLLAFALPVIFAYTALKLGWYQGGATNRGELLSDLSYQQLALTNPEPRRWQMAMLLPAQCAADCEAQLTLLRQAHLALGREQERVQPILFVMPESDPGMLARLGEAPFLQAEINTQARQAMGAYALVVIDPLGQWVMGYRSGEVGPPLTLGQDLLADLRKLLKLSRIG
ncbi:hypothetical protein [Ferrimonas gelatinilytica]|uniref:Cytochrome oxidase Cu insertion factor, SCO1/SenC/PrrC family n=1 Tax=Ferrimonas gelatinilytica TaxID=1255257 RepID=A0ABP9SAP6_9GAMM